MKWLAAAAILAAASLLGSSPARALLCSANVSDVAFGNVDLLSGGAVDTTAAVSLNCTGVPLTTVRFCLNLNAGSGGADATSRIMLNGGSVLRYQAYQNAGRSVIWGSTTWGLPGSPPQIDIPIGLGGSGSASATIYARILSGQSAASSGSYLSAFSGSHVNFAYALVAAFNCGSILALPPLFATAAFNVTATVLGNCMVSAQNLDFGSHGGLGAAIDAASQISATCTPGTAYTVGLSNGLTGTAPAARKMTRSGSAITYGLYRDFARALVWGESIGTNTLAATGNGGAQNFSVYGRVPTQTTPGAGVYSDTIAVTLTY